MKRLDGKRWEFFGVNENTFQVREVGTDAKRIFEAIEDPDDGYRSSLKELKEIDQAEAAQRNLFFNEKPFVVLTGHELDETFEFDGERRIPPPGISSGRFVGLQLADDSGHPWLFVGTDNNDDYYPGFVFSYLPPAGSGQ